MSAPCSTTYPTASVFAGPNAVCGRPEDHAGRHHPWPTEADPGGPDHSVSVRLEGQDYVGRCSTCDWTTGPEGSRPWSMMLTLDHGTLA